MPSVGTAYVNIRVNSKDFTSSLDNMMKQLSKKMEAAGKTLGKDFKKGIDSAGFDQAFKPLETASDKATTKVKNNFQTMGDKAGGASDRIGRSAQEIETSFSVMGMSGDDAAGSFARLNQASVSLNRSLQASSRSARKSSGGFSSASSGVDSLGRVFRMTGKEVDANVDKLRGLYHMAAFGGSALGPLIGGLVSAGEAVFVLGANAAAAAPALAALASGAVALGQVGGTVALAMHGVGDAISAGFKSLDAPAKKASAATADMGKAIAAAARGVRDAKDALQDTYRETARAAEDAARKTVRAEADLAQAQRESKIAQASLNAARKEGLEQLEDIAFAAEDAGLAEQRATLDLQDAFAKLQEVSSLPPDDRARVEAELAYKEAELNMRQAVDAREDADKAQTEAAKKGVEGTDAVTSAREDLASANDKESEAAQALADARREEAETAIDNADKIAEAQQRVADAQQALADAHKKTAAATDTSTTAVDKFALAMKKLGPQQQEFVNKIIGMRDEMSDLRKVASEPIFSAVNDTLDHLVKGGLWEGLKDQVGKTSETIGSIVSNNDKAMNSFDELMNNKVFQGSLTDTMDANQESIKNFGGVAVNLADAFVQISDAAAPLLQDFSSWVEQVTKGWSNTARAKNETGALSDKFQSAADRVREFWGLIKQAWRTLKIFGDAALTASDGFGDFNRSTEDASKKGYISTLTRSLRRFNNSFTKDDGEKKASAIDKFHQALLNVNAAGRAFKRLVIDPLVTMASDKDIEKTFNILSKSDALDRLADTASNAGPELATLATSLADLIATISETGSIDQFLKVLNKFARALQKVADAASFELPDILGGGNSLATMGKVTGTITAVGLAGKGLKILASPAIKGIGGTIGGIGGAFKKLSDKINGDPPDLKGVENSWSRRLGNMKTTLSNLWESTKNIGTRIGNAFKRLTGRGDQQKELRTKDDLNARQGADDTAAEETEARTAGTRISASLADGITEGKALVEAAMEGLEATIKAGLIELQTKLQLEGESIGLYIMEGISEGLTVGEADVLTDAQRIGRAIVEAMEGGAGVQSPSTKTIEMARQVMAGVPIGLEEGTPGALTAADIAGTEVGTAVGTSMKTAAKTSTAGLGASMGTAASASLATGMEPAIVAADVAGVEIGTALSTSAAVGTAGMEASFAGAAATVSTELAVVDASLVGTQAAMETTGVVARVSSLGVRAFGGAMALVGGPFGIIMLLLPLLIPILIKLWNKFEVGKKLMDGLKWTLDKLADAFSWVWDKIKQFYGWIKTNWPLLLAIITGPFGLAVYFVTKYWDQILDFIKGVPDKIRNFLSGLWDVIKEGIQKVWQFVKWYYGGIFDFIRKLPQRVWNILKNLWKVFSDGLQTAWTKIQEIWGRIITWVAGRPEAIKNKLVGLWDSFSNSLSNAFNAIKSFWNDKISPWIGGLKDKVTAGLAGLWDGLGSGLATVANGVGRILNTLVDGLNSVIDKFGGPKDSIGYKFKTDYSFASADKKAKGGPIFGPGTGTSDLIPTWLSNGEHVLTAAEVRAMGGHKNVQRMRKSVMKGKGPGATGGWRDIPGLGKVADVAKSVGSAISNGAEYAVKWVIDKFVDKLPDNIVGQMIGTLVKNKLNVFSGWGKDKDEEAAAAYGGIYTGPPGGWTYPLGRRYPITQMPNAGHNPSWSVDIGAPAGTAVRAATRGTVRSVISLGNTSYGNYIVLSHAGGESTLYAHLRSFAVKAGQSVKTGQLIGYSDSTGNSTGNHLHFEVRPSTSTYAAMKAHGVTLARGGVVAPSPQGTLALLAEAGKHERVTPLDPQGFTPAERRMLEVLESKMGGGGDTYNVHPSPGMNEESLADLVARRVRWQRRRGAGRR